MDYYVDLASAYAQQLTNDGKKGEWIVYNQKKEKIHSFPKDKNEKEVMELIHFGRKFELLAFNAGIEFQKAKVPETITTLQKMVMKLTNNNKEMTARNEMLANELDKLNLKFENLYKEEKQ